MAKKKAVKKAGKKKATKKAGKASAGAADPGRARRFFNTINPVGSWKNAGISAGIVAVAGLTYLVATRPTVVYDGPWGENGHAIYTEGRWSGTRLIIGDETTTHEFTGPEAHSVMWDQRISDAYKQGLAKDQISNYTRSEKGMYSESFDFPVDPRSNRFDKSAVKEMGEAARKKFNSIRMKMRKNKQDKRFKRLYDIKRGFDKF